MPTKEQIEAIIALLQPTMRICDWDISVEIVNSREIDNITKRDYIPGGYCLRNRYYKTAKVYMNKDYEDYEKEWYYILIHELYHVVFEDMDNFWDNEIKHAIAEDRFKELDNKHSFYIERLNCDLTRQFLKLCPVTNFNQILEGK